VQELKSQDGRVRNEEVLIGMIDAFPELRREDVLKSCLDDVTKSTGSSSTAAAAAASSSNNTTTTTAATSTAFRDLVGNSFVSVAAAAAAARKLG